MAEDLSRQSRLALWFSILVVGGVLAGLMAYEAVVLDWHPAREEPAGFTAWHWVRMWTALGLGMLTVGTLVAVGRPTPESGRAISPPGLGVGWAGAGAAAIATGIFVADPALFHRLTIEDGAIEWVSALFLFTASALLVGAFVKAMLRPNGRRRWVYLIGALGLAGLFFLMAMEEISWFQRVIGFETPESMAGRNWQGEFNFHNLQTDISELGLYFGTGVFLILLPLMRETVGDWRPLAPFRALLPDRAAAAAGASMLFFTYGHWNLLPIQLVFWVGFGACLVFAVRARRHGWQSEFWLFASLVLLLVVGQAVFLFLGHRAIEIFDATEYREFVIGLGLAVYGWRQWRSTAA